MPIPADKHPKPKNRTAALNASIMPMTGCKAYPAIASIPNITTIETRPFAIPSQLIFDTSVIADANIFKETDIISKAADNLRI